MNQPRMHKYCLFAFFIFHSFLSFGQLIPIENKGSFRYCLTPYTIDQAIKKNPAILDIWRRNGEIANQKYLLGKPGNLRSMTDTIVIPIVFHLVDVPERLEWISDRALYDQVEILNNTYHGVKSTLYQDVIPKEMYALAGSVPIKFILARQDPDGRQTNGIERRPNKTPDRISIKSAAGGGLDPWDVDRYVNVWVGTFSGDDIDLLGVSTMPFLTTEGPAGMVINIASLPASKDIDRMYYPQYSEGMTLAHELGHYFYLFHTFGDQSVCNNDDFEEISGWPLTYGRKADDTPPSKLGNNISYGNPSGTYTVGCTSPDVGEMYGNIMNYFDDRSLFMLSLGQSNRVMDCIDRYYPDLPNSNGTQAPPTLTDAYLVSVAPYGSQERIAFIRADADWAVKIMNYGGSVLNNVDLTVEAEGNRIYRQKLNVGIGTGKSTTVNLGQLNIGTGRKLLKIYTSNPNSMKDDYAENDTVYSFINIVSGSITTPHLEEFGSAIFPPAEWSIWNPNENGTWAHSTTSGSKTAGSATMQFSGITGKGQLDELVMPAIDFRGNDSAFISFDYAYRQVNTNPLNWDGLEIYISNDKGKSYQLAYKKSGQFLRTINGLSSSPLQALPSEPEKWKSDTINLTPFMNNHPLLIKFRAVNSNGNNLYLDNINVRNIEVQPHNISVTKIDDVPIYVYGKQPIPNVNFTNSGKETISSITFNYLIDNGSRATKNWSGTLTSNQNASFELNQLSPEAPGRHILTVYSSLPNGLPDDHPADDTTRAVFYQMGKAQTPVKESFETTGFFDPQWVIQKNGNGASWEGAAEISSIGKNSVFVDNYQQNLNGDPVRLFTPEITPDQMYDSLFLSLDYAYPLARNNDTLQISLTPDEGKTFITLFEQGGAGLTTTDVNSENNPFIPGPGDWDSLRIYLTPLVGNSPFQIVFSVKGHHGNNVYLDNINVFGVTVPDLVKQKGYLFYPSPFRDQFIIRHFETPTDLRRIRIVDAAGRVVWQRSFNGDAQRLIHVSGTSWVRGVYFVRLDYDGRNVVDKVVKQ